MATNDLLGAYFANNFILPTSTPAILKRRGTHFVAEFNRDSGKSILVPCYMPRFYSDGSIKVEVVWTSNETSGTVGWLVAFERVGAAQQDIDSDGFGSDQTITATTVPATSGNTAKTSVTVTAGSATDSVDGEEYFRLRLKRDLTNDTATTAQVQAVILSEA